MLVLIAAGDAQGIVRRDDVPDTDYIVAATNFPAVGALTSGGGTIRGSGVLVGEFTADEPRWVLTAAHISTPSRFAVNGVISEVIEFIRHPDWDTSGGGLLESGLEHDIALALIHPPAGATLPSPALWHAVDGDLAVGVLLDTVGVGQGGTGLTGETGGAGTLRAAQNTLRQRGSVAPLTPVATAFEYRFHAPGDSGVRPREGMAVFLDSGGPVWADFGDGPVVVGVHSYVNDNDGAGRGTYGDDVGSTRVPLYDSWIRDVFEQYENAFATVATSVTGPGTISPDAIASIPVGRTTNFLVIAENEDHHIAEIAWNSDTLYINTGNRGLPETNVVLEVTTNSLLEVTFTPSSTISGIPLTWLTSFGITNKTDDIEDQDLDGDGFSVLQEFIADTHPVDSNDFFAVHSIDLLAATNIAIILSRTSTQRLYRIESTDLLHPADWQEVISFTGNGIEWEQVLPPATAPKEFYRATVTIP